MRFSTFLKEDCIGKYKVYCYGFSEPMPRALAESFAALGPLEIFDSFPRPFFRVRTVDMMLKGIVGDTELEVTYMTPDSTDSPLKTQVESLLSAA